MDNGDATQGHAMTPEEFAKLMGAYPQPAENPLPAYGGYMDNSPANFSFVEFNDYFGAESEGGMIKITGVVSKLYFEELMDGSEPFHDVEWDIQEYDEDAETFEAPYAGAGSLFGIKQDTGLEGFTTSELTTSSAIHGDFDEASLNYSGHQNFEVRAETIDGRHRMDTLVISIDTSGSTGDFSVVPIEYLTTTTYPTTLQQYKKIAKDTIKSLNPKRVIIFDHKHFLNRVYDGPKGPAYGIIDGLTAGGGTAPISFILKEMEGINGHKLILTDNSWRKSQSQLRLDAEMEMIDDSNARIRNRFGDEIGMVAVDDHDVEDAVVEVSDGSDVIQEVIVSDAETKKSSMIPLALGAVAAIIAFPKVTDFFTKKEEKASETPELIESPNTGNLDPAQYEELVVESTGYAVDVIPQVLDGSFMGSRFAALPTERYVEYNEPGIGAHTDIALNRDEIYLEPEMAMVQASENVIKESQAPGQSPYNSTTGEENPDFDMRVLKETQVISLDPAAKPFIPQSMSGYTGNANTPPSVLNKMFNTGVLGQTPAFVPGSGDMGANHFGSRNATPNTLGLGGSVGGPLSDQVNANYTDGTTSMSLAQWSIENTVSQTSDTEAVVIDRSSGLMKRVRRV